MIRITIYFDAGFYVVPDADEDMAYSVYQQIARGNKFVLLNDDETQMVGGKMFMTEKITHVTFDEVEVEEVKEEYDDIPF